MSTTMIIVLVVAVAIFGVKGLKELLRKIFEWLANALR